MLSGIVEVQHMSMLLGCRASRLYSPPRRQLRLHLHHPPLQRLQAAPLQRRVDSWTKKTIQIAFGR